MIRVILPYHLSTLAKTAREVHVEAAGITTQRELLDALESQYPVLRGTIRDHGALVRRPLVRFFACGEDLSHDPPDALLPAAVIEGIEAFYIIGAIAGGSDKNEIDRGYADQLIQYPASIETLRKLFGLIG
jgi:hypothetical protein